MVFRSLVRLSPLSIDLPDPRLALRRHRDRRPRRAPFCLGALQL